MIVGDVRVGVKIVVAVLKHGRACRTHRNRGLRQFLTGDERAAYTSV